MTSHGSKISKSIAAHNQQWPSREQGRTEERDNQLQFSQHHSIHVDTYLKMVIRYFVAFTYNVRFPSDVNVG